MPACAHLPHYCGAFGIEKLHAYFNKWLFLREQVQKRQRFIAPVKVQRDNNILTDDVLLL